MFKVSFINDLPVTPADIAAATVKDPILTQVCQYVLEGWASIGMKEDLCVFHQQEDYLSTDPGCVLWGTRVLIPGSLQACLLNELCNIHPGIVKMKLPECSYIWWPKLNQDTEEMVKSCRNCAM